MKNNPFKMAGSYIGIVLAFFIGVYDLIAYNHPYTRLFCNVNCEGTGGLAPSVPSCIADSCSITQDWLFPLLLLAGFLIGWAVHSFIKRR